MTFFIFFKKISRFLKNIVKYCFKNIMTKEKLYIFSLVYVFKLAKLISILIITEFDSKF